MCILKTDKTDRCYESPKKEIFLLYNNKSIMTSIQAKKKLHHLNCGQNKAKQTMQSSLQNRNKKRKGEKNCSSICFLKNKKSIKECDYTPYILHY